MKKLFLPLIITTATFSLLARLFYLQIIVKEQSKDSIASDIAIEVAYDYPQRGYIYDRNGKLLVTNQSAYDIMIVPREVKAMDTLEFCNMVNISKEQFLTNFEKAKNYENTQDSSFRSVHYAIMKLSVVPMYWGTSVK